MQPQQPSQPLEKELETYRRELPQLLKDEGKFVLIQGDKVHGTWATYDDAIKEGYRLFQLTPFLVKRISSVEQVQNFTRNVTPACRSFTTQ
jgi:hypothetical protein